jgi:hypothetical protein
MDSRAEELVWSKCLKGVAKLEEAECWEMPGAPLGAKLFCGSHCGDRSSLRSFLGPGWMQRFSMACLPLLSWSCVYRRSLKFLSPVVSVFTMNYGQIRQRETCIPWHGPAVSISKSLCFEL